MPHGFDFYRIFCSTPGTLDDEQDIFLSVLGEVNEQFAHRTKRLFVPVVCRGAANSGAYNGALRQNVRDADFFVQILGHSWGAESAEFEELFDFATECHEDDEARMRDVALLFKDVPAARLKPTASAFREKYALAAETFRDLAELDSKLSALLQNWLAGLPAST
jgi:hypothetical protein